MLREGDTLSGCRAAQVISIDQGQQRCNADWLAEEVAVALVVNGISYAVMMLTPVDLEDFARGFLVTEGVIDEISQIYDIEVHPLSAADFPCTDVSWIAAKSNESATSVQYSDSVEFSNVVKFADSVEPINSIKSIESAESIQCVNFAESVTDRQSADAFEIAVQVDRAVEQRLKLRRRAMAGRTGCGLCGVESLQQFYRPLAKVPKCASVELANICQTMADLRAQQPLQNLTGATHAAAWCHPNGEVALLFEDIGRHNALDKLIGAMLRLSFNRQQGFACITSRASFEMIQKAAQVGIGIVVAISAPTAYAIAAATQCGIAIAGFVRNRQCVVYTQPEKFGVQHL